MFPLVDNLVCLFIHDKSNKAFGEKDMNEKKKKKKVKRKKKGKTDKTTTIKKNAYVYTNGTYLKRRAEGLKPYLLLQPKLLLNNGPQKLAEKLYRQIC